MKEELFDNLSIDSVVCFLESQRHIRLSRFVKCTFRLQSS